LASRTAAGESWQNRPPVQQIGLPR